MTVDTQELFDLHLKWSNAEQQGNLVEATAALNELARYGIHPAELNLSSKDREQELLEWENTRLKYQYHLSKLSNFTLIGPEVPGLLAETSVAIIRDTKGRGRTGQSGENKATAKKRAAKTGRAVVRTNDLANNEEVKEAARTFTNINLIVKASVEVVGSRQWLRICENDTDWRFLRQVDGSEERIANQFASKPSTIQALESNTPGKYCPIPGDVAKTVSETANILIRIEGSVVHVWDTKIKAFMPCKWPLNGNFKGVPMPIDGLYVQVSTTKKAQIKNIDKKWFRICMERAHFNTGKKRAEDNREMVKSGINFVSRHLDQAGRPAIAFCLLKLSEAKADELFEKILKKSGKGEDDKFQWQPYLFFDNTRDELYTGNNSLKDAGARLLLYMVETEPRKFEVMYSSLTNGNPDGEALSEPHIEKILCEVDSGIRFQLHDYQGWEVGKRKIPFDYSNASHRKSLLLHHCQKMTQYYRRSRIWTDLTNTPRKSLCGKDGEQLAALYAGARGDRSMARGDDIVEDDGESSEVKHISGRKGDAAFTLNADANVHLGAPGKITSQKRLFLSWMEDIGTPGSSKLHMKLLVSDKNLKNLIDSQHDAYYGVKQVEKRAKKPKDKDAEYKADMQWHSQPYDTSIIGGGSRKKLPMNGVLDFSKHIAFEFIEGSTDFAHYNNKLVEFK